jgi:hypothetical protein
MSEAYNTDVNDMFRVTFKVDNAEFEGDRDAAIADALERVAAQVRESNYTGVVFDGNGGRIGDYGVKLADGHTMP